MKILTFTICGAVALTAVLLIPRLDSPVQAAEQWRILFDGKTLDAWRGYRNTPVPSGWKIEGGALVKNTPVADLVTKDEFGDFELELDWKIGEAGNSGILY